VSDAPRNRPRRPAEFLDEDVGPGDVTSNAVWRGETAKARIVAKERCVLCGVREAAEVFDSVGVKALGLRREGEWVEPGAAVLELDGPGLSVLVAERTALNFIQRMSGIATLASKMVAEARRKNPEARVAGTRKTTPGLRHFEKRALEAGGAEPHRMGLYDAILIKDNHVRVAGSVAEAVRRAREAMRDGYVKRMPIEVEVQDMDELREALEAKVDRVMLDNFSVEEARRARDMIPDSVEVEVSGGITLENVSSYSPFADLLSSGALTHSARACDFSLEIEEVKRNEKWTREKSAEDR
jgi:nicotinate-nucleotide pyrophosphorylase (carboxylating)